MPILFRADLDVAGLEPWVTDGTLEGTGLLRDTSAGDTLRAGGFDIAATVDTGVVFRVSNSDYDGFWYSNGRASETVLISYEFGTGLYNGAIELNDAFFSGGVARIDIGGLFGPSNVETLVRTELDGSQSIIATLDSRAQSLVSLEDTLVFVSDGALFGSDGTQAGTQELPVFLSPENIEAKRGTGPIVYVDVNNGENVLFRSRSDEDILTINGVARIQGESLWLTDGTASGTIRLDEIGSITGGIRDVSIANGKAFVTFDSTKLVQSTTHPNVVTSDTDPQIWQINLDGETATQIASLGALYPGDPAEPNPQTFGIALSEPIVTGDQVGFVAYGTSRVTEDGRSTSTSFADFHLNPFGTEVTAGSGVRLDHIPFNSEFFIHNDQLLYSIIDGATRKYFAADISTGEPKLILETSSVKFPYIFTDPFVLGENLVFVISQNVSQSARLEIYAWDGDSNSVELIGTAQGSATAAVGGESNGNFTVRAIDTILRQDGDLLYFIERSSDNLIVTDGTVEGTRTLAEGTDGRILGVVPYAELPDGEIFGTEADNALNGTSAADEIFGFGGDDTIRAGSGSDKIDAGAGDDRVFGGKGADTVLLGAGNDYVKAGGGAEDFDGGSGKDYISYYDSSNGITVNLGKDTISGSWAVNDTIKDFESFGGSRTGGDTVTGTSGANTINTYGGNDRVFAGKGSDKVNLGSGNDYVKVGGGAESFEGGSGKDWISYYDSTGGIKVNLQNDTISGSWAVNDTIKDFESFSGSKTGGDDVTGTTGSNTIRTYGGNDRVSTLGGTDVVELGSGNDYVRAGGGKESFDGGSGKDYISYYDSSNGIRIDLRDDEVSGSWAVNDTIKDFESASGSRTGDDVMLGTNGANTLRGNGGDDKLYGRGGSDKMYGGSGEDFLDGGGGSGTDLLYGDAGADTFHFDRGEGVDVVKDFENNVDLIQLDGFALTKTQALDLAEQVGDDVVFDFGSDGMLTVENTTIGRLGNDLEMV